MLTEERRTRIIEIVNQKKAVSVNELVDLLDTSAATIRRDINELNRARKIVKVFGGATAITSHDVNTKEDAVKMKAQKNIAEKDNISRYAAGLIQDNDFVYIDAGTTTLAMIDYIDNHDAKYITNGVVHAKRLMDKGFDTIMIGGRLKRATEAVVGPDCIEFIRKYHFTKAFMGTNGISIQAGFTTPDVDEAMIKTAAIRHAYMSYILADHSKFDEINSVTFADIKDCTIITDELTSKEYLSHTTVMVCE
ncbi:DeoR/GlpR family DNA-binding transcription regulator [Pseudobutyrivibrio xylanivorans]|uniref:DeoR/GlpR transcriptional regulator n=1 Tax=Pseudobutyrivibrio xylanivorans TaxID=185007 RepID=A0A5P6VNT8_PSEXY|nr:DeoR/GlpR family DNA-binding transcription regulator [Pseudobutyrivibrio xylanivorans]QFJ54028.1 DeoR/GlpR transcriptional regulator [Pseudobutyrivibrio xylanivorans]